MAKTIKIDPVTRIEGHLSIGLDIESNRVKNAYCAGEMFRGFEVILKNRAPMDAQQITQRICGVCPVSHGMASVKAQEDAYGISPPTNGRLLRNLILGANYIQSHIIHFYHLSALDFIDITAVTQYRGKDPGLNDVKDWVNGQLASNRIFPAAPFLPRYESAYAADKELNITAVRHYLEAFDMRRVAHEMGALFAGKLPHAASLVPGGITETVSARKIAAYGNRLDKLRGFITTAYLEDILGVARAFPDYFTAGRGCGNFLSYGVFPEDDNNGQNFFPSGVIAGDQDVQPFQHNEISEDVTHSWYESSAILNPEKGRTVPVSPEEKKEAYSWLKAPRYGGKVMEVGPLARILVAYKDGNEQNDKIRDLVNNVLSQLQATPDHLISVLGRHAVRALECKLVADRCAEWLDQLKPGEPSYTPFDAPEEGSGMGLTEAPRGALGHWISIKESKIDNYQCVVPTTWNCSPRDESGTPGAVEQALHGTRIKDPQNPIEATRLVRSFDPCIACAVH